MKAFFLFSFTSRLLVAESGNPLFVHRVATRGGIWGFFFYACWMCHLIATATPDHAALLSLGRVVRSGLGWVAGLVLGSLVSRAMPILAPYFCQHPVSYGVVATVHRGAPPAGPRAWESHPITRLLHQHVDPIRRRCLRRKPPPANLSVLLTSRLSPRLFPACESKSV